MDILFKHRTLAKNTILTEYNEKKRRKLDRQSGFEDGLASGIERGMEAFILDNLEEGVPEERIIDKLMLRFQLDNEKAQDYVQKYK